VTLAFLSTSIESISAILWAEKGRSTEIVVEHATPSTANASASRDMMNGRAPVGVGHGAEALGNSLARGA
jgi:hypothetical protein